MSDTKPADSPRQMTPEEAAEFAEQVFNKAREGDAAMLAALLSKGLPANLRNHKGDTLLMLASYHGHVDAVKVLFEHKADPEVRNDNGQSPIAGAAFKVTWRWSKHSLKAARKWKAHRSMAAPR